MWERGSPCHTPLHWTGISLYTRPCACAGDTLGQIRSLPSELTFQWNNKEETDKATVKRVITATMEIKWVIVTGSDGKGGATTQGMAREKAALRDPWEESEPGIQQALERCPGTASRGLSSVTVLQGRLQTVWRTSRCCLATEPQGATFKIPVLSSRDYCDYS